MDVSVTPKDAHLLDDIRISVTGCQPGERVRITAALTDGLGISWTAAAEFIADHAGEIDLATAPSIEGSYEGCDAAGLFWSMRPSGPTAHGFPQPWFDPGQKVEVTIEASTQKTATAHFSLSSLGAGIERFNVRDGDIRGVAFKHIDRSCAHGSIMCLGGSGGGLDMLTGPLLASLGYDVLCLAFFAYDDLPPALERIPLEYFEGGAKWMQNAFDGNKIAVHGTSRGGELALILASTFPQLFIGTTACVPMHVATYGAHPEHMKPMTSWTYQGKDVPGVGTDHFPLEEMRLKASKSENGYAATPWYRQMLDVPEAADAEIEIENASGPILLVSGKDDQVWPSSWGSDRVVNRLRARGFEYSFKHLSFPNVGHWIANPNTSTQLIQTAHHGHFDVTLSLGGEPTATAQASRVLWTNLQSHYQQIFGR